MKRIFIVSILIIIIVAVIIGCSQVTPQSTQATIAESGKTMVNLSKTPVTVFNAKDIELLGSGLYRMFDQEAQVVCYIYNNFFTMGYPMKPAQPATYSGISCLPVSETNLK